MKGLGQREEAIVHLKEAIRLDPARRTRTWRLALPSGESAEIRRGRDRSGARPAQRPNSKAFLLPLGCDLVQAGKYQAAIDILREVVRQSPGETDAYVQMAEAFRKTGSPDREVQILRELCRRKPDYPMVHVLIVRAMLNIDHPDYAKGLEELARQKKQRRPMPISSICAGRSTSRPIVTKRLWRNFDARSSSGRWSPDPIINWVGSTLSLASRNWQKKSSIACNT